MIKLEAAQRLLASYSLFVTSDPMKPGHFLGQVLQNGVVVKQVLAPTREQARDQAADWIKRH